MIRVRELLELEPFREFELLAGEGGLDRPVACYGVLDYEVEHGDYSEFAQGEFVISSLLLVRELSGKAGAAVTKLVERGAAALAVRVFDRLEVPAEMRDIAERENLPLFVFRKAHVNDLFVAANGFSRARERSENASRKLDELLGIPSGGSTPASIVRAIDPQLLPCCTAAFCVSPKDDPLSAATLRLMVRYSLSEPNARRLFMPYGGGVLLFASAQEPGRTAISEALAAKAFRDIGFEPEKCRVGVGSTACGYEEYALAVAEAMRAARICRVLGKPFVRFEEAGAYRLIMAAAEDRSAKRLCAKAVAVIESYDAVNSSGLLETLAEYVRTRGDVRAAAQSLFQHPNTIRYRLKKAASLLGLTGDVYEQLFMMMSVYLVDR